MCQGPREEREEERTHASVSCGKSVSAVARRNQCAILEFIGPSGIPVILRMESRRAAVHDLLMLDGDWLEHLRTRVLSPTLSPVALRLESGISTSKRKGSIGCWGKGEKRERRGGRHSRAFSMLLHPIHSPRRKTSQSLTDVLLVNANARKESPSGREQEQRGSTPSPTSKMTTTKERIGFLSPILYRYWKIDASLALSLLHTSLPRSREKGSLIETFPPLSEGE